MKIDSTLLADLQRDDSAGSEDPPTVPLIEQQAESLRVLASEGFCAPGEYPWDFWKARALAAGVSEDLAGRGREVMREAHQHGWHPVLKWICGWNDDGDAMIALALEPSGKARAIWQLLMDTDGFRGNYHPQTHEWISWT